MTYITQAVVYRRVKNANDEAVEFLIIKRVPEDGGFWQAVTGTIEQGESPLDCLRRELAEEIGVTSLISVSPEVCRQAWATDKYEGTDIVFGVEIAADTDILLDTSEHTDFQWIPLTDALRQLKYDGNRQSMQAVYDTCIAKSLTP